MDFLSHGLAKQQKFHVELAIYVQNQYIQNAYFEGVSGIVINPAAYTHTSIAILDAVKSVMIPTVEIHISDVSTREDFRQVSYIRQACIKTISGKGTDGYLLAIDVLIKHIQEDKR